MKKIGVLAVVASLVLSLAVFGAQKSGKERSQNVQKQSTTGDQMKGRGRVMDANSIEKQLAQLKVEHQKAMAELQGIKKLALEEKAPKTAAALDKLIASAEQNFQKEIAPLQQRLDRMKGVKKQGEEGKKGAGKRTGGKKTK